MNTFQEDDIIQQ